MSLPISARVSPWPAARSLSYDRVTSARVSHDLSTASLPPSRAGLQEYHIQVHVNPSNISIFVATAIQCIVPIVLLYACLSQQQ